MLTEHNFHEHCDEDGNVRIYYDVERHNERLCYYCGRLSDVTITETAPWGVTQGCEQCVIK